MMRFVCLISYQHYGSAMTLLNVRQEQLQAIKTIPKQDYEIDLIDDNRQTLIEQERVRRLRRQCHFSFKSKPFLF